jgi:hypothetical protein
LCGKGSVQNRHSLRECGFDRTRGASLLLYGEQFVSSFWDTHIFETHVTNVGVIRTLRISADRLLSGKPPRFSNNYLHGL